MYVNVVKRAFLLAGLLILLPIYCHASVSVTFQINENYLVAHTLANSQYSGSKTIKSFKNKMWNRHKEAYVKIKSLGKRLDQEILFSEKFCASVSKLLQDAKETREFSELLQETHDYLNEVEAEWILNYEKSYTFMRGITRLPLIGAFTVYITHPMAVNGKYLGRNIICWGTTRQGQFLNYNTIYLWHEILHEYIEESEIGHIAIQLSTDNLLRAELNNEVLIPSSLVGHDELHNLQRAIFDKYWSIYLKSEGHTLVDFVNLLNKELHFE